MQDSVTEYQQRQNSFNRGLLSQFPEKDFDERHDELWNGLFCEICAQLFMLHGIKKKEVKLCPGCKALQCAK